MDRIALSRLEITGSITDTMPLCVIREIGDAHGIRYHSERLTDETYLQNLIEKIEVTDVNTVRTPYTSTDYSFIARFVNQRAEWRRLPLEEAFAFLQRYMGAGTELPLATFEAGLQTPAQTHSLNGCVLYKLCSRYDIRTTRATTLGEMTMAIRMLTQPALNLHEILAQRSLSIPKNQLINMLMNTPDFTQIDFASFIPNSGLDRSSNVRDPVSHDTLQSIHGSLTEPGAALRRLKPQNNNEAVVLAALNFKIDLTSMRSPLLEYALLEQCNYSQERGPYVPVDERAKVAMMKNRDLFRLDINFNPMIPVGLYVEDDLKQMVFRSGYQQIDILHTRPYEILQLAHVSDTFYAGMYPNINNIETPFSSDDLPDLDPNVVICYGNRETGLTAMRYSELSQSFRVTRNFGNPLQRDSFFEPVSMRKLKILCGYPKQGESQVAAQERQELYRVILETEVFNDGNGARAKELLETYIAADDSTKGRIRHAFMLLLEMSMFMRGWQRCHEFPVGRVPPVNNQVLVDTNVTESITSFENACRSLNDIGEMIMTLPLLQYRGEYVASADSSNGLTIRDRVNIVKEGEETGNTNSCIRLSSNWFAATAHRYMQIVGMPPPFEVEHLRSIS